MTQSSAVKKPSPASPKVVPTEFRKKGKVKFFKKDSGFGFIICDGAAKDVFVHKTDLDRAGITALAEGQDVVVDYGQGSKGLAVAAIALA